MLSSCYKQTYAYKFSYDLDIVAPSGQNMTMEVTSFYPCGNLLTPEEEICLTEKLTVGALERDPNGYNHRIELDLDFETNDREEYHCP